MWYIINPDLEGLVREELTKDKNPRRAINRLINNLLYIHNYSFELKPTPIKEIAKFTGLKPDYEDACLAYRGDPRIAFVLKDGKVIFGDPSDEIECRFSLGHEVGHLVIEILKKCISYDHLKKVGALNYLKSQSEWYHNEDFCDIIAREFVCPRSLINGALGEFLKCDGELDFERFDSVCKELLVSYETLTQQLDKSRLLNELLSGILISMFGFRRSLSDKFDFNPLIACQALPKYFESFEWDKSIYYVLPFIMQGDGYFPEFENPEGRIRLRLRKTKKEEEFRIQERDIITFEDYKDLGYAKRVISMFKIHR